MVSNLAMEAEDYIFIKASNLYYYHLTVNLLKYFRL